MLGVLGMIAVLMPAGAGAAKVDNPGQFELVASGGQLIIGKSLSVNLTPGLLPECSDGIDNDGDNKIDLDDPQCVAGPNGEPASEDNSELAPGFQPYVPVSIVGNVDADGNMSIPTSGIQFPPSYVKLKHPISGQNAIVTIDIIPTAAASGSIDPGTGFMELSVSLRAKISGNLWGNYLDSSCSIGKDNSPISVRFTTDRLDAIGDNPAIAGSKYNPSTGRAMLVSNDFAVPGSSGCTVNGGGLDLSGTINDAVKLGSKAGKNMASLAGRIDPILTPGVNEPGPAPVVAIATSPSPATGKAPLTVSFNSAGTVVHNGTGTYVWDFGDGSSMSGAIAMHTYDTAGDYTATLTVTDSEGLAGSATVPITVTAADPDPDPDPDPVVTAVINTNPTPASGDAPLAVSFNASASTVEDGPGTYAWDFGDGATASGATTNHTYTTPGTYTAAVTVTDAGGRSDSASVNVNVTEPQVPNNVPTARIVTSPSPATGEAPFAVGFDGSASTIDDAPGTYAWDFGDGTTASGATANHTYTTPGTYTAKLVVTDADGDTDTATVSVKVNAPAVPELKARIKTTPANAKGDAPLAVSFDASTSTIEAGAAGYAWDFGDGATATGVSADHTYTTPGTYTATLTVTDTTGATDSASVSVKVNKPVDPNEAGAVSIRINGSVSYDNSGTGAGNMKVKHDSNGLVSVKGSVDIPSTAGDGSTAKVTVKIERVWILPLWIGEVKVADQAAKTNVKTPIIGQVSSSAAAGTAGSTMSWFKIGSFPDLFRPYTLTWSVTDSSMSAAG